MERTMLKDHVDKSTMMAILEELNDFETHRGETFKTSKKDTSAFKPLDKAIRAAMDKSESDLRHELGDFRCPNHVNFQDSVTIRDHVFTTYRTSENHGVIFFREAPSADSLVPAMVDAIFLVPQDGIKHVFLAVYRYLALPAIYRDWDHKIMVMKPLNRVSDIILIER
jgi:hypothetical protein